MKYYEKKNIQIGIGQQWTHLFSKKANWKTLSIIYLQFEKDNMFKTFEVEFNLLGFLFRFSFIYNVKACHKAIKKMAKGLIKELRKW